jgi:hypothetical protein
MNSKLGEMLDKNILFVLGSRLARSLAEQEWDAAIRTVELMEPVALRIPGEGIRNFQRAVIRLAQELAPEHPREPEFVDRARHFAALLREEESGNEISAKDMGAIPSGAASPLPLPVSGELLPQGQFISDLKTVLAYFPNLAMAIRQRSFAQQGTTVSFLPGWHLLEFRAKEREESDFCMASMAFFVRADSVAPINGNPGVLFAIAETGDIDLSTTELAKQYLTMFIASRQVGEQATGPAGRLVEPGDPLPFLSDTDEDTRAELSARVKPCEVRALESGSFATQGTLIFRGQLNHFRATIAPTGIVEFEGVEEIAATASGGDPPERQRYFLDYVYTAEGWRVLIGKPQTLENPVASGEEAPTSLPTTLPTEAEGERLRDRPCVVSPPGIDTFAGLPLEAIGNGERDQAETILQSFEPDVLRGFDLAKLRCARLPFLPTHTLVLIPHHTTGVGVPFVAGNGKAQLVGRANSWLYQLMEDSGNSLSENVLVPFAKFFFAVIAGGLGRFTIVESVDEVPWSPAATDADRERVREILTPIRYLGRLSDGSFILSMHVVFKNALFRTNYEIGRDWVGKFSKQDLVLEEQPFLMGESDGLIVAR